MSLTKVTYSMISGTPINAFDYMTAAQIADVQARTRTLDVTIALQNAIDASNGKQLFLPAGSYKITSALTFTTAYGDCYYLMGENKSESSVQATEIYNAGTGHAISIISTLATSNDSNYIFENMNITGTSASQSGIHAEYIHGLQMKNLWVSGHGFDGLYMKSCWGSKAIDSIFAQNYHSGAYLYNQNNNVTFLRCTFNGNGRAADGYAGLFLTGTLNNENLNVTAIGCDFSYNGYPDAITQGLGIVAQYTKALVVQGCYIEQNKSQGIYADTTVENLTVSTNYIQDNEIFLTQPQCVIYENNQHFISSLVTYAVKVSGYVNKRIENRVKNNFYAAGVTTTFSDGVKETVEIYHSTTPSAGTWKLGDIVWSTSPYSGGPIGWVCTVAGTPGTWNAFGTVS